MLSNMLKRKYGIDHEVLNAKQHEREAQIVALAGQTHKNAHGEIVGNVTIATNMAGRGTDIKPAAGNVLRSDRIRRRGEPTRSCSGGWTRKLGGQARR